MNVLMHGHHNTLFSFFPTKKAAAARIVFIRTEKPEAERELRLALVKDVTSLLPRNAEWEAFAVASAAYAKAAAAYIRAVAAHAAALDARDVEAMAMANKMWATANTMWTGWKKARLAYLASFDIEAFHREHCHPKCPWDGRTIFAKGRRVEVLS